MLVQKDRLDELLLDPLVRRLEAIEEQECMQSRSLERRCGFGVRPMVESTDRHIEALRLARGC